MSKAIRRKNRDAKRAQRDAATPALTSDLGKAMWSVFWSNERAVIHGRTYDRARAAADSPVGGVVMTDAAASRMHGFNEMISQ